MSQTGPTHIAMIGAGFIAQVAHLHALARIAQARVVVLAEAHDGLRRAVAKRFAIPETTANYQSLLQRRDIEGFIVCLPRRAQSTTVAELLAEPRHVLSEKPMAMTLQEAETMVATAARSRAAWTVGYMKRHDIGVRHFCRILDDLRSGGGLGPIVEVAMLDFCAVYGVPVPDHIRRDSPRPNRFAEAAVAPDFVPAARHGAYEYTVNVASHDINLLRLMFGDTLAAISFELYADGEQRAVFDAAGVPIRLVVAPVDRGRWDQVLEVTFARGRATLTLPSPLAREESAVIHVENAGRRQEFIVPSAEHVWAFEAQARAFIDSIGTRIPPANSGAESLGDMRLIDALWRKAEFR